MTPKEKAQELVDKYYNHSKCNLLSPFEAKNCALIAVDEIIRANPHSNPLNTNVYSTMDWWQKVKKEIETL